MITDACPQCEADHLDLQALTFSKVGPSAGFAGGPAAAVWDPPASEPSFPSAGISVSCAVLTPPVQQGHWLCPGGDRSNTTEDVTHLGFCEQH